MIDPTSQLRSATRRAKSDVANKLISMFLHELSRKICKDWPIRVDSEEYQSIVRAHFGGSCPYCGCNLADTSAIVEHLDGMNRYRVGLHVPGNVFVACKRCNSEKRRDDSKKILTLAHSGWESFLSHDGTQCTQPCPTCKYWSEVWADGERESKMAERLKDIRAFRSGFADFQQVLPNLAEALPALLTKLYSDCQSFAEGEITLLLERF